MAARAQGESSRSPLLSATRSTLTRLYTQRAGSRSRGSTPLRAFGPEGKGLKEMRVGSGHQGSDHSPVLPSLPLLQPPALFLKYMHQTRKACSFWLSPNQTLETVAPNPKDESPFLTSSTRRGRRLVLRADLRYPQRKVMGKRGSTHAFLQGSRGARNQRCGEKPTLQAQDTKEKPHVQ